MNRFIFVCYGHGSGGEGLSVLISSLQFCNDLKHEKHNSRTWTYDYFNKLFLNYQDPGWLNTIKHNYEGENYEVNPKSYTPEVIKKKFPDALYVVINSPRNESDKEILSNQVYEKVWLTKHDTLSQRVGFFLHNNNNQAPTREQMKILKDEISNGEIRCMIEGIDATPDNIKKLHLSTPLQAFDGIYDWYYDHSHNLFALEYRDMLDNKTQPLLRWLTKKIKTI